MLPKGNKIIGPASAIALICFFMPWVLVSCNDQPVATLTGWQLAAGVTPSATSPNAPPVEASPILFVVLLAALASLALVFFVYQRRLTLRKAAYAALALAGVSLLVLLAKFANAETQTGQAGIEIQLRLQYGFWGTVLAQFANIAGAFINLKEQETPAEIVAEQPVQS